MAAGGAAGHRKAEVHSAVHQEVLWEHFEVVVHLHRGLALEEFALKYLEVGHMDLVAGVLALPSFDLHLELAEPEEMIHEHMVLQVPTEVYHKGQGP